MFHATTIVAVKRDGRVAVAGDGQVTFAQNTVIKKGSKENKTPVQGSGSGGFCRFCCRRLYPV